MRYRGQDKKTLLELLAEHHKIWGKIKPTRDFDDEGGGESGEGGFRMFETHPLLNILPEGASSDLSLETNNNKFSKNKAEERYQELTLSMQKKLDKTLGLGYHKSQTPTPFGERS